MLAEPPQALPTMLPPATPPIATRRHFALGRFRKRLQPVVTWGLYPTLLLGALAAYWLATQQGWSLSGTFIAYAVARLALLLVCERCFPLRREWGTTLASLARDLKYALINGLTLKLTQTGIAAMAIEASRFNLGLVSGAPLGVEVVTLVLAFEFFQYAVHRLSHEGRGAVGRFLWRVHAAHHLPTGVYLLMHPVVHPLGVLLVLAVNAPLVLLGASSEAVFVFNALMGLQGLVSHLNVDLRVGPLNYLLVGTELHRYHHSADLREAKNYGALTPLWDLLLGTFVYRPGHAPQQLGVAEPLRYPRSEQLWKVLAFPFRKEP